MVDVDDVVARYAAEWRARQRPAAIDFVSATAPNPRPRRRAGVAFVAALGMVVVLVVVTATVVRSGHATPHAPAASTTAPRRPSVRGPHPRVVRTIDLGQEEQYPASVAATPDWVSVLALPSGRDREWVTSISAGSTGANDVQVRLADNGPIEVVAQFDSEPIWVSSQQGEQAAHVFRVRQGTVDATLTTEGDSTLAISGSNLWVVDGKGQLLRVESATARIAARVSLPGGGYAPKFISAGSLGVWLASPYDGSVWRLDVGERSVRQVADVGSYAGPLVQLHGDVWVTGTDSVTAIDARNGAIAHRVKFATRVIAIASDGHAAWVATADNHLYRVEPNGHASRFTLPRTGPIVALAADTAGRNIWVLATTSAPDGQLCHNDCPKLIQISN
jgi:hypothetical protein